MGDRTYCSLYTFRAEPLTEAEAEQLAKAINDYGANEISQHFAGFEEVNYGTIPDEIEAVLTGLGISYKWFWGNGGGYSAGVQIYDAEAGLVDEFYIADGMIVVPLDTTSEQLENARLWAKCLDGTPPLMIPEVANA